MFVDKRMERQSIIVVFHQSNKNRNNNRRYNQRKTFLDWKKSQIFKWAHHISGKISGKRPIPRNIMANILTIRIRKTFNKHLNRERRKEGGREGRRHTATHIQQKYICTTSGSRQFQRGESPDSLWNINNATVARADERLKL